MLKSAFFCAARELSLNSKDIDQYEADLADIVANYKKSAKALVNGHVYRLRKTNNEILWQLTSDDQKMVYLGYFRILASPNLPFRRAKLVGLDPDAHYRYSKSAHQRGADEPVFSGGALMDLGVDLPCPCVGVSQTKDDVDYLEAGDFSSRLMLFKRL